MTGDQLRKKIKAKGYTLKAVADTLGILPQTLYMRLSAESISTDTLERIAAAIGESVSYFYNELPIIRIEDYAEVYNLRHEIDNLNRLLSERERYIASLEQQLHIHDTTRE